MSREAVSRWSLRARLLTLMVLLACALVAAGGLQSWQAQREASQRLIDASMRETAGLLLQLAQHEIQEHGPSLGVALLQAETRPGPYRFRYQIWSEGLHSAYRSADLPAAPLVDVAAEGFGWTLVDGQTWRTFAAWNSDRTLQIQIAQPDHLRRALDRESLLRTAGGMALLLAAAVALLWWVVRASLRGLQQVADEVAQRRPDDLHPLVAAGAPRELAPILDALDGLLGRVRLALLGERRFTADAAHELRTPLAAIRTNAQVLLGAAEADRAAHAADLLASVDRGTRLVEQLLALARADSHGTVATTEVALDAMLAGLAQSSWVAPPGGGVRVRVEARPATVRGVPALLEALVRNLVDNAVRHSPAGGEVCVACGMREGCAFLSVEDQGPGIPEAERARVFERFYRVPGTSSPGSGLGLSIVQRIAGLHGARVLIENLTPEQGTRVVVSFDRLPPG